MVDTSTMPASPRNNTVEVKYTFQKQLAVEGDGILYLGHKAGEPNKAYRLKRLFLQVELAPEELMQFSDILREFRRIEHADLGIVQDLLLCEKNNSYYTIADHIPGFDLSFLLFQQRNLKQMTFLHLIRDLLKVLLQASTFKHPSIENFWTHGDICPEKVIVQHDGSAKLLDFGMRELMKVFFNANPSEVSEQELCYYWEQAEGRKDREARDRYAVGLLLYEALTGVPLSQKETYTKLNRFGIEPELQPAVKWVPDLVKPLQELLTRALHENPTERFSTTQEFLDTLEVYLEQEPPSVDSLEELFNWSNPPKQNARIHELTLSRFIPIIEKNKANKSFWDLLPFEPLDEHPDAGQPKREERETIQFSKEVYNQDPPSDETIITRELPSIEIVSPELFGL